MEHFQFGMIITVGLDADIDGDDTAAENWADQVGQELIDKLPKLAGVEYRVKKIIHPQHLMDLEEVVDEL